MGLIILLFSAGISRSQSPEVGKIVIRLDSIPSPATVRVTGDDNPGGIGLALSGGGSRALAHIGVLKALSDAGIDIRFIAGVSMGSVVGGLYSAGYSPEEIENIAMSINWNRIFSQSPVRASLSTTQKDRSEMSVLKIRFEKWHPVLPKAITSGQNLRQYLETLSARSGIRPSISFDYLNPPLRIVTTDLSTGEKVVLSSGSLSEAMRAAIAVPVAFTPVDIDGRMLVDGGLVDPIPTDVVRKDFPGPVVAVDVSSELLPASKIDNVIDIADQTTTIMSMQMKRQSLAAADLVIKPDLSGQISTDFSDIQSIITAGETAAKKAVPKIRELLTREQESTDHQLIYDISRWHITGLNSMPMTLFKSVFANSDKMTVSVIKSNLRKALDSGYLSRCRAELTPVDSGYNLTYILTDNPRIDKIEISGATLFDPAKLKELIQTKPGMILNSNTLIADRKTLENFYIKSGYSLVRVTTEFDDDNRLLTFRIDEGRINRIVIEGNHRTRSWAIRRHVPFHPGDIYMQAKAERGVEDLYGTDLFETAKFVAVPDSIGVTLKAIVSEKAYKFIRMGGRFDLEYGSKAFFDLVDDNLFGAGLELYTSTTVGEKHRSVALNFEADRIWNTLYTYKLTADYGEFKRNHYVNHDYQRAFREFHHGGELSLGRQIPRLGTISAVGEIRRYRWDEPGKANRQSFDKISIGIRSIVDTRDAIDFPERGKYHTLELEFTGNLSVKDQTYTKFFTSIESYYRLTDRLNFHPKMAIGGSSNFLPYFDKFSLGGALSFPGLYEDEILGDKIFIGDMELRYRLIGPVYVAGLYSFGNIWNKLESIRLSELRLAGGVGFAIKTPVGPISTWYGRTGKGLDAFYLTAGYDW